MPPFQERAAAREAAIGKVLVSVAEKRGFLAFRNRKGEVCNSGVTFRAAPDDVTAVELGEMLRPALTASAKDKGTKGTDSWPVEARESLADLW